MVVFVDQYSEEWIFLRETLQTIDSKCEFVLLEDSFFLPDKMLPLSEYFVRERETEPYHAKSLHHAFLEMPSFWQIQVEGHLSAAYDMDKKKAMIYFTEPLEKRHVARVEWLSETGCVYKIDYYNRYGFIGCRELRDPSGTPLLKTYYTSKGEEVISYDLQRGCITFFENGCVKCIYDSVMDLEKEVFAKVIASGESIILTSQRQVNVLQEVDVAKEANVCVLLNDPQEIQKYQQNSNNTYPYFVLNNTYTATYNSETKNNELRICYNSAICKQLNANGDILILTSSDQVIGIENIIVNFSDVVFHIAAHTAVSDKLLSLRKHSNVRIYPQISRAQLLFLLENASFYLDINYGREIYSAVIRASMQNLLILGFENTLHDKYYVLDECVFAPDDCEGLILKLRNIVGNEKALQALLARQNHHAKKAMDVLSSKLSVRSDWNGNLCI